MPGLIKVMVLNTTQTTHLKMSATYSHHCEILLAYVMQMGTFVKSCIRELDFQEAERCKAVPASCLDKWFVPLLCKLHEEQCLIRQIKLTQKDQVIYHYLTWIKFRQIYQSCEKKKSLQDLTKSTVFYFVSKNTVIKKMTKTLPFC